MLGSCKAYKQSVLFQVDEEEFANLQAQAQIVQATYQIEAFDQLDIAVYTNKGERLVDPNNALAADAAYNVESPAYTINSTGKVELPLLGYVALAGLTLEESNQKLAELYRAFYKDPFVITQFVNKRVIVLGASTQKVVPLDQPGMNLLEVIALAGDFSETGKGNNIRLLRGDLSNPEVHIIDLSTIQGLRQANLMVQPNDIIYIEPAKKPFAGLRDFTPILGALTSILALIVALNR